LEIFARVRSSFLRSAIFWRKQAAKFLDAESKFAATQNEAQAALIVDRVETVSAG